MKTWINFVKIKFHLNEHIEWNWFSIQLKRIEMQIDEEGIKNLLVNMVMKR
jgi:hypothetical protein